MKRNNTGFEIFRFFGVFIRFFSGRGYVCHDFATLYKNPSFKRLQSAFAESEGFEPNDLSN
ncbi:hypothetical protein CQ046_02785 [Chryseobacterium sp. MYb7]|nr:hypothetical protein CQ046_02785 [Chryseobacterium sp. MYb7]